MNVFRKESDIFGQYSSKKVYGSLKKFFKTIRKVKEKLGTDSYKLDKYLNMLLNLAKLLKLLHQKTITVHYHYLVID